MKTTIVLFANSPSLLHHIADMNRFIADCNELSEVGLCYFHNKNEPPPSPQFHRSLAFTQMVEIRHPYLPEVFLDDLEHFQNNRPSDLMLFPGDALGQELAPRLAYRIGGTSSVNVEKCEISDRDITIHRPVYGYHMMAMLHLKQAPYILSVTSYPHSSEMTKTHPVSSLQKGDCDETSFSWLKNWHFFPGEQKNDLENAASLLIIGAGVENQQLIEPIKESAKELNAALAGSRPVVMNGWLDMDHLIGISGKQVTPQICIVAGVSGMPAFLHGIKKSSLIIAINRDPNAPIFKVADVGIVGDLNDILTALRMVISAAKEKK